MTHDAPAETQSLRLRYTYLPLLLWHAGGKVDSQSITLFEPHPAPLRGYYCTGACTINRPLITMHD
eukprot:COSAG05_NODE_1846_length_3968_cov_36.682605_3_plen_66_part_00